MDFDAEAYWRGKPKKVWVVTLWRGQGRRETRDTKYVRSATEQMAVATAKFHSPLNGRVQAVARLATPTDLGAQPANNRESR